MRRFVFLLTAVLVSVGILSTAVAQEAAGASWYKNQLINEATAKRLGIGMWSCCDGGDVYKTRFRKIVNDGSMYGAQYFQYWKDNDWHNIPPDIVQHKPTPNGQSILFLYTGKDKLTIKHGDPLCFIIDKPKG